MEEDLVKHWKNERTFERSMEERPADNLFVFYDGPPFATGLPHYGHIVASTIKDVIPRYATMQGYRVERRWGWDCHGLPIENLIEKELGLTTKQDIEEIGVDKFNEACKNSVLRYAKEWCSTIDRLGRWIDMSAKGESPAEGGHSASGGNNYGQGVYRTMDIQYTESIWWAFKQLYDQGLIYEGRKSMHLCPRCETTLSNFEVTLGYKDVTDQSVTAQFELVDEPGTYLLAWTTTPWTLPGNIAVAIGADIEYVKVEANEKHYILAHERVSEVFAGVSHTIHEVVPHVELEGMSYKPLFPYYSDLDEAGADGMFKVYLADFVTTEDGTGMVHIAGGYGEDDYQLGKANGLPIVQHVGTDGKFKEEVTDFAGELVKPIDNSMATDQKIVQYLGEHDKLFSKSTYLHSYPHCWRCDTPLLNYATSSWFVRVTEIKDRMIEHNKSVNWIPDHIKAGRFGKWLEGAKDWAISRDRYWGAPLPIWQSDDGNILCVGSIAELKELSGEQPEDLHKQFVDKIVIKKDGKEYRRVPQVLDCWFESGSMPYAQEHYPFDNKEKFDQTFPAQFIAEGLDQTRGWFYTLMVLSTALFDKPAFQNVIVNGMVLAEDGKKMSKRLKNYPEPNAIFEQYGADALRLYLMNSSVVRSEDLRFSEKGVDQIFKRVIMTLWNVHTFYEMYAKDETVSDEPNADNVMDKWIINYTNKAVGDITAAMNAYELQPATRLLENLVQETSTWYLRRSRDRFKAGGAEKIAALSTLRYVLLTTVKMLAPFTPFITERIYLDMAGPTDSVHLELWPTSKVDGLNETILEDMEKIRQVVEQGLAWREEAGIKVRQPLASMAVPGIDDLADDLKLVLADEINVKKIKNGTKLFLDTKITPELAQEGLVREFIRGINALRKKNKLTISDETVIVYSTSSELVKNVLDDNELCELIKKSTKTVKFVAGQGGETLKLNEEEVAVTFQNCE